MRNLIPLFCLLAVVECVPVGTVLNGIADWERDLWFVDLVKQSRRFGSPKTPWDENAKLGPDGWPTEDFGVILLDSGSLKDGLTGTYSFSAICGKNATVSLDGRPPGSTISYTWDAAKHEIKGTVTLTQEPSMITLALTNTGGGCKNLTFMLPQSFSPNLNGFTKPALNMLQSFQIFRFMPWTCTNDNPTVEWEDRQQPNTPSFAWSPKQEKLCPGGKKGKPCKACGVSWEEAIKISNQLSKDMWVNVPAHANDNYVRQLAMLIKKELKPELKVYVEWSNEVWNGIFSQSEWNIEQAQAEVKNGDPNHFNYDNDGNKWYWGYRRTAFMLKHVSSIFMEVFGETNELAKGNKNVRVRPLLAGQLGGLTNTIGLKYINAVFGAPNKYFWGVAVAPYFGTSKPPKGGFTSPKQVLDQLDDSVKTYKASANVSDGMRLALTAWNGAYFNLEVHSYEGGSATGLIFGKDPDKGVYKVAEMMQRMETISYQYLENWYGWGFKELNWFVCCASSWNNSHGFTWGIAYDVLKPNTMKMKAIMKMVAKASQPIVGGTLLPNANINASVSQVGSRQPYQPSWRWLNANHTASFVVNSPTAATYKFIVSSTGRKSGTLGVQFNNGEMQVVSTSAASTPTPSKSIMVQLKAGLNGILFTVLCDRANSNCGATWWAEHHPSAEAGERAPYDIYSFSLTK